MTDFIFAVNTDTQDEPFGTSAVDWTIMNLNDDYLIFTKGSNVVADGEAIPGSSDLNQAGIIITDVAQVVPKYFLADYSAGVLKEINNAGGQNKRYVFAFDFDGATASEPVLEVWDDSNMDSVDSVCLGEGTPAASWVYGITTTSASPGVSWEGTDLGDGSKLAGSSAGHFLELNDGNGALSVAKTLYAQLKIVIPASINQSGFEQPLLVVKYTSN